MKGANNNQRRVVKKSLTFHFIRISKLLHAIEIKNPVSFTTNRTAKPKYICETNSLF